MAGLPKRASVKQDGEGLDLHRPRQRAGMGLGLKFAAPVSIAIALVMLLLGFMVMSQAGSALEAQIDESGVFAATTLAAPDWHNPDNVARLKDLLTENILEVAIFEKNENGEFEFVISGTGRDELGIRKIEDLPAEGSVQIERGLLNDKAGDEVAYRAYRKVIFSPTNRTQDIAAVQVFLSEELIRKELSALLTNIVLVSILGIALAVGVAFLIARSATRPLSILVHDIDMIARGKLEHRTQVRSRDEIGLLASAVDDMTRGLAEANVMRADLSSKEHEEQITLEIQERLFPATLPEIPGCRFDAVFEAGGDIASDLFDFVTLDEHRTGFLLLSASGRGVPAAVILAMARSTFRATATAELGPADTLKRINALFSPDLRRGMYVTAMYAVYDARDAGLRMACAGHKVPAIRFDAAEGSLARYHPGGIAMGLDKGPVFDRSLEEAEIVTAPGDVVVFATPGLYAITMSDGEELGEKRYFKAALSAARGDEIEVATKLARLIDSKRNEDDDEIDLTLVSLKRIG